MFHNVQEELLNDLKTVHLTHYLPPVLNTGGPHHQHQIIYDQDPILQL